MRRFALILFALCCMWSAPILADTELACLITTAQQPRGVELCDMLQIELPASNDWDFDACATYFFRTGMLAYETSVQRKAGNLATRDAMNAATLLFYTNFPRQWTQGVCGNSIVEPHLNEECDPPGVACDSECQDI